jgi:hypothetical protein
MTGYGIKVETDTGHLVWLTHTGTAKAKTAKDVMRFDSEAGAEMERNMLARNNPHAKLVVAKF